MPFNWKKNLREQPADTLLLLDECHFLYLAAQEPDKKLALVLKANPHIAWYIKHKLPELDGWVEGLLRLVENEQPPHDMQALVGDVMASMEDWIIYVTTPDDYHRQSFVGWDERELTQMTDYAGKTVVDIGSGTGKQAFALAPLAQTVFCVEPVWNLRRYLKARAEREHAHNVYVVDGVIERLPFPDAFADVVVSGHVVGDDIPREMAETLRVTKPGGMVIMCPGNNDEDNDIHRALVDMGCQWSRFLEPGEDCGSGYKRKYWKTKA